jgi:putative FmdB family regulatory protein
MPTYDFQCYQCGLAFEKFLPISTQHAAPCPECNQEATRALPPTVSGHFKKEVTGPMPQNTGIHDLDTHVDRVIGQHAAQGWDVARARRAVKEQVMDANGVPGEQLSRNLDGSYRAMAPEEKAIHKRSQIIHQKASQWRANQAASKSNPR